MVPKLDLAGLGDDAFHTPPAGTWLGDGREPALGDEAVLFCGRGQQLGRLGSLVEAGLRERKLRCAVVQGPLGSGKSRMLRELGRICTDHLGVAADRVLVGTMPGEAASPVSAFTEQLRSRCGIRPGEQAQGAREKILRCCRSLLPAVRATEVAHCLGELLGVPFPDSPVATAAAGGQALPAIGAPRTYVALKRFLAADAGRSPLVLLFDEMEQASAETVSLLHYLAESLVDLPVFIGIFASPDFLDQNPDYCSSTGGLLPIDLPPLSTSEAVELFCYAVHASTQGIPVELVERVESHPEGSPRTILELVALLRESGALYWIPAVEDGDDDDASAGSHLLGQWDRERLDGLGLPPRLDLSGLVETRLSVIEPGLRALLEKAAVCGEHFYFEALLMLDRDGRKQQPDPAADSSEASAAPGPSDAEEPPLHDLLVDTDRLALSAQLDRLVSCGLVQPIRDSQLCGEREYRFAYPPWRDIVYSAVSPERRRRSHGLLGEWLLLHRDGQREPQLESIARHFERGGRGSEAAVQYRRAAQLAASRRAYSKVPRLLLRALSCLGSDEVGRRLQLWQELGAAMIEKGDFDAAFSAYEKLLRLAHTLALRHYLAEGHSAIGQLYRHKGEPSLALEHLTRAYDEWTALADSQGLGKALDDLGQVLWLLGRTEEALDHAGRGLELRRRLGHRRQVAASLLHIGAIEQHRGLLDHAVGCYEEALRKHDGDLPLLGACLEALGSIALLRGDLPTARRQFEQGLAHIEPLGPSPLHAVLACRLGEALLQAGELDRADSQLQAAKLVALRLADRRALAEIQRLLALVLLRRDERKPALDCAQRALEQAQKNGVRHEIARALLTLGEVHAATLFDETAEGAHPAWDCFRRSVALLREVGDQAELALALYQLGRHLIERGRVGPAKTTLREAEQLATQLHMGLASEMRHMLAEL